LGRAFEMASEVGGREKGFQIAIALRGFGKVAGKAHDGEAGGWKTVIHHAARMSP